MQQQAQTLEFFTKTASDWQRKSINPEDKYSVIQGRNNAVLSVLAARPKPVRFLDVGCGTGQLVIEAAAQGAHSEGIDFSAEMIEHCEKNKQDANSKATFIHGSFYDVDFAENSYDVISAQGFIEYVSPDEMAVFFERCYKMLKKGGMFVVGSRNRLYNLFSLNAYSEIELGLGTVLDLYKESILHNNATSAKDLFEQLAAHEKIQPQPESHPITGINVEVRYQYSPSDLVFRLKQHGFSPASVFPVHYHALTPVFKQALPQLHSDVAKTLQAINPSDFRLVPFSSTFVLAVEE